MSNDLALMLKGGAPLDNLPVHLQGQGLGVSAAMLAAIGDSRNRIGLKGSRFRQIVMGQELGVFEENYLDVIILGVVPHISRIYYAGTYSQKGDNAPPTCYSADGIAPPLDVPTRQSDTCALCPQNVKGSKTGDDGYEGKACGFFRRMVIMLPGDTTIYVLDVKAQGIFADDKKDLNLYSMNGYAKLLGNRGVDASQLVTRLSFDTDVSVPKLFFKPSRFVTEEEWTDVLSVSESGEVADYLKINFKTIDLSKEQSADTSEADSAVEEAEAPAPAPATQKPVQAARPVQQAAKPAPAQTAVQRPAQTVQRPAQQAAKPAQQTARPAAAKPAQQAARPVQQAAKPTQQAVQVDTNVAMPESQVIEVESEGDLKSLIAGLGL